MLRTLQLSVILGVASLALGCAGTKFQRPSADKIVLGKTTVAEAKTMLGEPLKEETLTQNGTLVKNYSWGQASVGTALIGAPKARAMALWFVNDLLVGHEFTSSYDEDKSTFDETKVSQIQRGQTTRQQIIEMFGQPCGEKSFPFTSRPDERMLIYQQIPTSGNIITGVKVLQKRLEITIEAAGTVSNVNFTSQDK